MIWYRVGSVNFANGDTMKSLTFFLLLVVVGGDQAIAGKGLSWLKKWKTPSSSLYLPRVSRCLVAGGFSCQIVWVASSVSSEPLLPATAILGFIGTVSVVGGYLYAYARRNHVTEGEQIGVQVFYLDDHGVPKRGEVVASSSYEYKLLVKGHEPRPIDFKITRGYSNRHDIYRPVEILAKTGDSEAIRHVGYVVNVFNDGFYELELLAEIDPSIDIDHTQSYLDYAIEPYRVIVDKDLALEDGGFTFNREVAGAVYENLVQTL